MGLDEIVLATCGQLLEQSVASNLDAAGIGGTHAGELGRLAVAQPEESGIMLDIALCHAEPHALVGLDDERGEDEAGVHEL